MTAYELLERAYRHRMGQAMQSIGTVISPRGYRQQSFIEAALAYSVVCACNTRMMLEYCDNSMDKAITVLKDIEVLDGHSGDLNFMWQANRMDAFRAYKLLYTKYFKDQV